MAYHGNQLTNLELEGLNFSTKLVDNDSDNQCQDFSDGGETLRVSEQSTSREEYPWTSRTYTQQQTRRANAQPPKKDFAAPLNKTNKSDKPTTFGKKGEAIKPKGAEERKLKAEAELAKKKPAAASRPIPIPKRSKNPNESRFINNINNNPSVDQQNAEAINKIRERHAAWEQKKNMEKKRRDLIKRQEIEAKREQDEQRKQMASQAWESWAANAAKKPKPVPLNRGFLSLRGTVSKIYINPNEWQSVLPENNKN